MKIKYWLATMNNYEEDCTQEYFVQIDFKVAHYKWIPPGNYAE